MAKLQDIAWAYRVATNGSYRLGHNTRLLRQDGGWTVRYHNTDVVTYAEYQPLGFRCVTVNTGGWFSVTTLQRIRHGLAALSLSLVVELGGKWRVTDHNGNAWTIRGNKLILRRSFRTGQFTGQVDKGAWERADNTWLDRATA